MVQAVQHARQRASAEIGNPDAVARGGDHNGKPAAIGREPRLEEMLTLFEQRASIAAAIALRAVGIDVRCFQRSVAGSYASCAGVFRPLRPTPPMAWIFPPVNGGSQRASRCRQLPRRGKLAPF